jgi:hypothetical protein
LSCNFFINFCTSFASSFSSTFVGVLGLSTVVDDVGVGVGGVVVVVVVVVVVGLVFDCLLSFFGSL